MFDTGNLEPVAQALEALNKLSIDDRLTAMALIYKDVSGSISADAIKASSQVSGLVSKIEQKPQDRQIDALRDILTAGKNDKGEEALDPNPSKALGQLVTGGSEDIPTGEYGALDTESKLAFWYHIAQKLGNSIPSNISPSSELAEVLNPVKSFDDEKKMSFLKRLVGQVGQ